MTVSEKMGPGSKSKGKNVLTILGSGVAAGLIASLAVSALILLAERVALLPVGTFYLMLVSAITQTQEYSLFSIAQGLLLHLATGSVIGLIMSIPFAVSQKAYVSLGKYAPAYGLAAGVAIWLVLFLPVTYGVMLPLLQSLDGQAEISQRAPIGDLFRAATSELLTMIDRVVYMALVFNAFYGLLALILTKSFASAILERKPQVVL